MTNIRYLPEELVMSTNFKIEEETNVEIRDFAKSENVIPLCCIAPFVSTRVAPSRSIVAAFRFPDEFIVEEFVDLICEKFPQKESRPPLYLLIHSPGGTMSSSYVVSRVLRNCFNKIIGFIPHIAASGATIMALSCNELVMGDISRLTGIDPYHESNGQTVYALSIVRAFDNLVKYFQTKTLDEAPYPFQHLMKSITAENYDDATHTLELMEIYATELMQKAGYNDEEVKKILSGILYDVKSHEEVFMFDKAKEMGIKVKLFTEDEIYKRAWTVMKHWLRNYYLKPSPIHIIRYALPTSSQPEKSSSNI